VAVVLSGDTLLITLHGAGLVAGREGPGSEPSGRCSGAGVLARPKCACGQLERERFSLIHSRKGRFNDVGLVEKTPRIGRDRRV
jgi:hypothetical protein